MRWQLRPISEGITLEIDRANHNLTTVDVRVSPDAWKEEEVALEANVHRVDPISGDLTTHVGISTLTLDFLVSDGFDGTDLAVIEFDATHHPLDPRGNVHLTGRMVNQGDVEVPRAPPVARDPGPGGYGEVPSCPKSDWLLPSGCAYDEWITVDPGPWQFGLCANSKVKGTVRELEKGNNCMTFDLEVPGPTPDLVMQWIRAVDPPVAGQTTEIEVQFTNLGNAPAPIFDVQVSFEYPPVGPGSTQTVQMPGLISTGVAIVRVPWTPPAEGLVFLRGSLDPGHPETDFVAELDETNNSDSVHVTVGPPVVTLPDLILQPDGVTVSPSQPLAGDTLTFTLRARNLGTGPTPPGVFPELAFISGGVTEYADCAPLGVYQECVAQFTRTATEGVNSAVAIVDPAPAQVVESDELNNRRTVFYVVGAGSQCTGTWEMTPISGTTFQTSASGYYLPPCDIYWAENQPTGNCHETRGIDGMVASWKFDGGATCPTRVHVRHPDGSEFRFAIDIQ